MDEDHPWPDHHIATFLIFSLPLLIMTNESKRKKQKSTALKVVIYDFKKDLCGTDGVQSPFLQQ